MTDKISWFVVEKAYAQFGSTAGSGKTLWGFFNPFVNSSTNPLNATTTAQKLITLIIMWVLGIAAVIAFIYLVLNGIGYITAGGDAEKATKARTGILNAIIGIAVITLAFIIMRFAVGLGTGIGSQGSSLTP